MERHEVEALMNGRVAPLETKITNLQLQLQEKDRQLEEKNRQLEEKNRQLEEKNRQLEERNRQLEERDSRIAELEEQIQQRNSLSPTQCREADRSIMQSVLKFVRDHPIVAGVAITASIVTLGFLVVYGGPALVPAAKAAVTSPATPAAAKEFVLIVLASSKMM